jgi:hypothetical protein
VVTLAERSYFWPFHFSRGFQPAATAAFVRVVRILSSVTNVPSTLEITAEHLNGGARPS